MSDTAGIYYKTGFCASTAQTACSSASYTWTTYGCWGSAANNVIPTPCLISAAPPSNPPFNVIQCTSTTNNKDCLWFASGFMDATYVAVSIAVVLLLFVAAIKLAGFAGEDG